MVTCTRCGRRNEDDARFCVNCGGSFYAVQRGEKSEEKHEEKREDTCFSRPGKRMENECFGLPHGGTIIGLFFGAVIILIGLGSLFSWRLDIGALIMIAIGILVIAGAIYGLSRRRD